MTDDEDEPRCEPDGDPDAFHIFPVQLTWWETPAEVRCLCGAVTWGQMNDLRTLTHMWEISPPCRSVPPS